MLITHQDTVSVRSHNNCVFCPTVLGQTDIDVTTGQCLVSDRKLASAMLIAHEDAVRTVKSKSVCSHNNCVFSPTVVGQTDSDVTTGQCLVSDTKLASAMLITHEDAVRR